MTSWQLHTTRPHRPIDQKDYRVGRSSTTMLRLVDLGVPPPNQVIYKPYSVSYVRGDLARIGDGKAFIEWTFDVSDIRELENMISIFFDNVTDTYASGRYIRSDVRTGDYADPIRSFLNYSCIVWRPELFGPDGTPVVNTPMAYQTVRFRFTDLVAV